LLTLTNIVITFIIKTTPIPPFLMTSLKFLLRAVDHPCEEINHFPTGTLGTVCALTSGPSRIRATEQRVLNISLYFKKETQAEDYLAKDPPNPL
jgi:hypothetical protein